MARHGGSIRKILHARGLMERHLYMSGIWMKLMTVQGTEKAFWRCIG